MKFNLNRVFLSTSVTLLLLTDSVFGAETGIFKDAKGILADAAGTNKVNKVVESIEWALTLGSAVPAIFFMVMAGVKFSQERYGAAIGSFVGAVICGIATFVVTKVMA